MSVDAAIEVVRGVGIGGATILVTWLGVKQTGKKQKTDTAQQMFDQLQEERTAAEERHTKERAEIKSDLREANVKIGKMEEDMRASYRRELARDDFIQELRNHIRLGLGPPPPEWPEELRRG